MARAILITALVGVVAAAAHAGTPQASRYAISVEQATHAVVLAHPELAGDAIELAAPVDSRESAPQLTAGPLERWGTGAGLPGSTRALARMKIHCTSEQVCLPFYVMVHLTDDEAKSLAPPVRPSSSHPKNIAYATTAATETGLRSGGRAMLVMDSGRLHLRVPVTCLQGGSAGSTIRVRALGRGAVYQATIIDGSTVRGTL